MRIRLLPGMGSFVHHCSDAEISPRPAQKRIPLSVGVGGTPSSAARAGRLGLGLTLVILGGDPIRFKPLADLYRKAADQAGHNPESLQVAVTGHAYISETTQQAKDEYYPYYSNYWHYLNRQRGMSTQMSREDFERLSAPETALFVGSSQQIIEKILHQYELWPSALYRPNGHWRYAI